MGNKLQIKKREEWIKKGAPQEALEFLGQAVDSLHTVAVEKNIVFKEKEDEMPNQKEKTEEVKEETQDTTETPTTESPAQEPPADATPEDVSKSGTRSPGDNPAREQSESVTPDNPAPTAQASVAEVIQKGIATAIVVALKEYNDSVVAPLQAQLAELQTKLVKSEPTVTKAAPDNVFAGFMNASDFLPSAAVAEMIKKQFGTSTTEKAGDVVVKEEKVEEVKTAITAKEVTTKNFDPNNVLAGF